MEQTATADSSRRIVANYYAIAGLYTLSASIIWGVNTLFLLDAGLSISEAFIANAAFSLGMVLFEIPTGVVADTLGRRVSFLLSVAVLSVTTLAYVGLSALEAGVVGYAFVSVFMGLGFTFYSGAVEAWVVDALTATGYTGLLDRMFARGQMISGAAMLVGTVSGGLLGTIDLAIPFLARAGLLAALFLLAWWGMHDIGFTPRRVAVADIPREMNTVARAGVTYGWGKRNLRMLMIVGFVQGGFLVWAFYAWQPYFLELLERDAVWVAGVMSALIALSTMAGNAVVEVVSRYCGRRTTLLIWAASLQAAASIGVGLAGSFWVAAPLLLVVTAALGVASPVRMSYFHHEIPSEQRATVISFDSMVAGAGGVGGQIGLGRLAEQRSIASAYVVGGVAMVAAVPLLGMVRRMGGDADVIVGARAGVEGTCAADGLPAIAAVESQPRAEIGAD